MNPRRFRAALALAAALGVAGCAPYASVSSVRPSFHPAGSTVGTLAPVERRISTALRQQKREPIEAIGGFLAAAQSAQQQLARDPANIAARDAYNFAVARVIGTIQQARLDPWTQPLRVPAADGDFVLTCKPDPDPQRNPALYDLTPADQLRVKGAYVRDHQRKEGIGAPLVAIERGVNDHSQRDHTMPRIYYGVTAVIRFEGRRAVIAFEDPLVDRARHFRRTQLSAGRGFHRADCRAARTAKPKKARTREPPAVRKIRRDRPRHAPPALRPEQDGRAHHSRPEGFAGDVGADVQSPDRRRADPAQLPILVLQLPDGLSVSILRRDPAARARRDRTPFSAAQEDGRHRPQHGRLHQPAAHHRHGRQALARDFQKAAGRNRDAAREQSTAHAKR